MYIDDISIFGEAEQAHLRNLEEVSQRIRSAGMKLKPRKCPQAGAQVIFLGHKISQTGVKSDPANIAKVRDSSRPEKAEDLKNFLGLIGFYSRFVSGYSDLARTTREEAEKDRIEWSDDLIESFKSLLLQVCLFIGVLGRGNCLGHYAPITQYGQLHYDAL